MTLSMVNDTNCAEFIVGVTIEMRGGDGNGPSSR